MSEYTPSESQHTRELSMVEYALGSRSTSVRCPACNTLYFKEPGCNYVQCALQSCNTWFCFHCGKAVDSVRHFTKGLQCTLGPIDVYRTSYLIRMMFNTNALGRLLLLPSIICGCLVLFPISMAGLFVYKLLQILTACFNHIVSIIMKIVLFIPVTIVALFVGLISIIIGLLLVILYVLFSFVSFTPGGIMMKLAFLMLPKIASIFGISSLESLYSDVQEARMRAEIESFHQEYDASVPTHTS